MMSLKNDPWVNPPDRQSRAEVEGYFVEDASSTDGSIRAPTHYSNRHFLRIVELDANDLAFDPGKPPLPLTEQYEYKDSIRQQWSRHSTLPHRKHHGNYQQNHHSYHCQPLTRGQSFCCMLIVMLLIIIGIFMVTGGVIFAHHTPRIPVNLLNVTL